MDFVGLAILAIFVALIVWTFAGTGSNGQRNRSTPDGDQA